MVFAVETKIVLPQRLFESAKTEEELYKLAASYLKVYQGYKFIGIENGLAICERSKKDG